jgi:hypothetical protein
VGKIRVAVGGKRGRRGNGRSVNLGGNSIVVSGRDYLSSMAVTSATVVGDVLSSTGVAPQLLPNSRLMYFAQMFEKYQIIKWDIMYVPTVNATSTAGAIVAYYDPDPADTIASVGINGVLEAVTAKCNVEFNVYDRAVLKCKPTGSPRTLFTSDNSADLRLSRAGTAGFLANSTFSASYTLGTLFVNWSIRFSQPLVEIGGRPSGGIYSAGTWKLTTGIDETHPFGTAPAADNGNNVSLYNLPGQGTAPSYFYVPYGYWYFVYQVTNSSTGVASFSVAGSTTTGSGYAGLVSNNGSFGLGTTAFNYTAVLSPGTTANPSAPYLLFQVTNGALTGTITGGRMWLFRLDSNFTTLTLSPPFKNTFEGLKERLLALEAREAKLGLYARALEKYEGKQEESSPESSPSPPTARRHRSSSRVLISKTPPIEGAPRPL